MWSSPLTKRIFFLNPLSASASTTSEQYWIVKVGMLEIDWCCPLHSFSLSLIAIGCCFHLEFIFHLKDGTSKCKNQEKAKPGGGALHHWFYQACDFNTLLPALTFTMFTTCLDSSQVNFLCFERRLFFRNSAPGRGYFSKTLREC